VTDVVYCGPSVQGVIPVTDAEGTMLSAFSAIGRGKGTKSRNAHSDDDQFTNTVGRKLTESIVQNEQLKGKIDLLVQVLRDVAASANLDSTESDNVRQAIIKVSLSHRGNVTDHYV
jgi:hypothetical protein